MQFVAGRMKPEKLRPGTERNDLVLNKHHLPQEINGWKQTSFEPAQPAEQLTEGQFWWTHSWRYTNSQRHPIVAFDQLGLHEWHELTVCYQANGWKIESRAIEADSRGGTPWEYVVARMSNPAGEYALLGFSVFRGDGQPMKAPHDASVINFTGRELTRGPGGIWGRLTNRITDQPVSSIVQVGLENRALQCQVFLVSDEPCDQELLSDAIQLHLATRQKLRDAWLLHAKSNVTN